MRDIVFLFGAGASYGAGDVLPEAPPLGSGLYAELARIHPGSWGALPAEVRRAFEENSNFEEGMERLHDSMSTAVPQLMREMAIYFVQFRPASGRTLYAQLIEKLASSRLLERVVFSSLNYDCVLEFSALQKGIPLNLFNGTDGDGTLPVWKLHGSCNMFITGVEATPGVVYSAGVTFEGGVEVLFDTNEVIRRWLTATALAPVMCLYMREKPLSVAPGAIKRLQAVWSESVRQSNTLCCVGVRPYPSDAHIWHPVSDSRAHIHFIGGRSDFEVLTSLTGSSRSHFVAEKFADGLDQLHRSVAEDAA